MHEKWNQKIPWCAIPMTLYFRGVIPLVYSDGVRTLSLFSFTTAITCNTLLMLA